jgi:superfamily II DNA/RNA helicase
MVQKKREGVYAQFLQAESAALLCTDVAARGIDIPDIEWIIQFEPPQVRRKLL